MTRWPSLGHVYVAPPAVPSTRAFGLTVGGVLAAIAALNVWRGHGLRAEALGAVAAALLVAAAVRPQALAAPARWWGAVGHVLGWFNSRVLLTIMYVAALCPAGVLTRLFGSDPLARRRTARLWTDYPARLRDAKHYERQF